jgi:hypothetical protein
VDTDAGALLIDTDAGVLLVDTDAGALPVCDGRMLVALPESTGSGHAALIITLPEASRAMLGDSTLIVVMNDFMASGKLLHRRRYV